MISAFTRTLFLEKKRAIIVFGMLVILYSFIFILLTLNDFAYLAGNIGLFLLLSVVMMLSGRIKLFKTEMVAETAGANEAKTNQN
jgi:inner membrane protein